MLDLAGMYVFLLHMCEREKKVGSMRERKISVRVSEVLEEDEKKTDVCVERENS